MLSFGTFLSEYYVFLMRLFIYKPNHRLSEPNGGFSQVIRLAQV